MAVTPKKTGLAAITDIEAPAYTQKDQDVASNVAAVANKGGALMKQAATAGLQQANRRGLLSSSMAVGAAQDSVLKQATAIGGQNASQNAANNLSRQGFEQGRVLQGDSILGQERLQQQEQQFTAGETQKQRDFTAGQNTQDRELRRILQKEQFGQELTVQERDYINKTKLQDDSQAFTGGQAEQDRELQRILQKQQFGQELTMQEKAFLQENRAREDQQSFQGTQADKDRQQQSNLQNDQQSFAADQSNRDRQLQQLLQKQQAGTQLTLQERELKADLQKQNADAKQNQLNRDLQTKLAGWNLDDSERGQVADLMKSYETVYEQAIAEINNNTKLKAEDREAQIKAATTRRNKRISLLEDLYNVDVRF